MAETLALPDVLRQAGAVMTNRGGRITPAHYGSAAGELAACITRVGLAVRSDLAVLSVTASPAGLDHLLARSLGHGIVPGGAAVESGAWWCRPRGGEVIVLCPVALVGRLTAAMRRLATGTVRDISGTRCVLNVLGRRASALLGDLGIHGADRDPQTAPPFSEATVGGQRVSWLLENASSALAIVDAAGAAELWHAIDAAGRAYGLCCVGQDSIERYLLLERTQPRPR